MTGIRRVVFHWVFLLACLAQCAAVLAQDTIWRVTSKGPRFAVLDVTLDSGKIPLAAWQIDVQAKRGDIKIVGIEGGEHPAYKEPAHYDPKALQHDHVKLAAFSTAKAEGLPTQRSRVATIHIQILGTVAPEFILRLQAAADPEGKPIAAEVTLKERDPKP